MLLAPILLLLSCLLSLGETAPTSPLNYNVHLFYYPWYGAPNISKQWVHWNGGNRKPPEDITSNYYPVLGPYDSCDPNVLAKHMEWISQSGAGVIASSWWGKGGFEDKCILKIMDAANKQHVKVCFHIEPYGGRTAQSVVNNVNYINEKYGSHPAYFRDPDHGNRSAFYIFDSLEITDWSPIDPLKDENIMLAQTTDQSKYPYFSGFYNYAIGNNATDVLGIWRSMNDFCKGKGMIWSPSIGPGYIDKRGVPNSKAKTFNRDNGLMYDNNWNFVFDSGIPYWVSITSFNEWHEGSMLEPTSYNPPKGHEYLTYDGAYNKTGNASEMAYIQRTKYWVDEYSKRSQH